LMTFLLRSRSRISQSTCITQLLPSTRPFSPLRTGSRIATNALCDTERQFTRDRTGQGGTRFRTPGRRDIVQMLVADKFGTEEYESIGRSWDVSERPILVMSTGIELWSFTGELLFGKTRGFFPAIKLFSQTFHMFFETKYILSATDSITFSVRIVTESGTGIERHR